MTQSKISSSRTPAPLAGLRDSHKKSLNISLQNETIELEKNLAKFKAEKRFDAAQTGRNEYWGTASLNWGSIRNYGKEVKRREKEDISKIHGSLHLRRQRPREIAQSKLDCHHSSSQSADETCIPKLQYRKVKGFREKDAGEWSIEEVLDWLQMLGLSQYRDIFIANEINGSILLDVCGEDLDYLKITALAHRKLLLRGIDDVKRNGQPTAIIAPLKSASSSHASIMEFKRLPPTLQQLNSIDVLKAESPTSWKDAGLWSNPVKQDIGNDLHVGSIDEEAESLAFKRAVENWRSSGKLTSGSAERMNDVSTYVSTTDHVRSIAESLSEQMDKDHATLTRNFEARRQFLKSKLVNASQNCKDLSSPTRITDTEHPQTVFPTKVMEIYRTAPLNHAVDIEVIESTVGCQIGCNDSEFEYIVEELD